MRTKTLKDLTIFIVTISTQSSSLLITKELFSSNSRVLSAFKLTLALLVSILSVINWALATENRLISIINCSLIKALISFVDINALPLLKVDISILSNIVE